MGWTSMVQTPQNPSIGPQVERAVVESGMVFSGVEVVCEICEDRGLGADGGGRSWDWEGGVTLGVASTGRRWILPGWEVAP